MHIVLQKLSAGLPASEGLEWAKMANAMEGELRDLPTEGHTRWTMIVKDNWL